MITEPGFYRISNQEYHHHPAINKSGLWELVEKSPAHFKEMREHPPEPTPALAFGAAYHLYVFQPDEYLRQYTLIPPDVDKRKKDGKLWYQGHENCYLIKVEDDLQIREMGNLIHNHPVCKELLSDGEAELSGFWQDPVFNIQCKIRLDWLNKKKMSIVDLKSSADARFNQFRSKAFNYGYHVQSALYLYGVSQITKVEHRDFFFIVQEKDPPYGIMIYQATEEMIFEGLRVCQKALEIYTECLENDNWPCYPEIVKDLDLPAWAKPKHGLDYIIE